MRSITSIVDTVYSSIFRELSIRKKSCIFPNMSQHVLSSIFLPSYQPIRLENSCLNTVCKILPSFPSSLKGKKKKKKNSLPFSIQIFSQCSFLLPTKISFLSTIVRVRYMCARRRKRERKRKREKNPFLRSRSQRRYDKFL